MPRLSTVLRAEGGGAPKYDKRPALVVSNEVSGRATKIITLKADDGEPVDYRAGHVLALEIRDPDAEEEKWLPAPYTVTRCSAEDGTFDVLYRVVGRKTALYEAAAPGDALRFGGRYKVPVLDGIDREGLGRVVGISTGVGVGPLVGFAEEALADDPTYPDVHLFVGFREAKDVCCVLALRALAAAHPDRFTWTVVLSDLNGHVSAGPNLLMMNGKTEGTAPGSTHYHLVGNGAMVNEWVQGLGEAGVPEGRVTHEIYFNHKAEPRAEVVEALANVFKETLDDETEVVVSGNDSLSSRVKSVPPTESS